MGPPGKSSDPLKSSKDGMKVSDRNPPREKGLIAQSSDEQTKIYDEPPPYFVPLFNVVACYGRCENKYVLLHRAPHVKRQPNEWGAPGGSIKKGEEPLQAAIREFLEETGVSLDPKKIVFFKKVYVMSTRPVAGMKNDYVFHVFTYDFSKIPSIKLNLQEHQAVAWKSVEEALSLPLVTGGAEVLWLLEPKL